MFVSSSDLIALLVVPPGANVPAKICPELVIVTLFPVPETSVRVMVLVLLFIIPPALFVTVEFCAFNKLIAFEPPELIVPELVTLTHPDLFLEQYYEKLL